VQTHAIADELVRRDMAVDEANHESLIPRLDARRPYNFLCGVAIGLIVVSVIWLMVA
jgi:hypothetical protein